MENLFTPKKPPGAFPMMKIFLRPSKKRIPPSKDAKGAAILWHWEEFQKQAELLSLMNLVSFQLL